MSCSIKICGITTVEDALMVSEARADYLGVLVNVACSPRSLTVEKAREIFSSAKIPVILLTFDLTPDQMIGLAKILGPFGIQLAGNEAEEEVGKLRKALTCEIWKTIHIPAADVKKEKVNDIVKKINNFTEAGVDRIILDSAVTEGSKIQKGGTGQTFDWSLVRKIKAQLKTFIFLAGGITPDNVKKAIVQVNPDGIDLSSGVEESIGKKDPLLVNNLISTIKKAEISI